MDLIAAFGSSLIPTPATSQSVNDGTPTAGNPSAPKTAGITAVDHKQPTLSATDAVGTLFWRSQSGELWKMMTSDDPQTGFNSGALFDIYGYTDQGDVSGLLVGAHRGSGPLGTGIPYFSSFAPYTMNNHRAVPPGGVIGNVVDFSSDAQPTEKLGPDPLTVSQNSPIVSIAWPHCCGPGGPVSGKVNTWVKLDSAITVGGIIPSGWLEVTGVVDADHFNVLWATPASSSSTGGGSSVKVTPSTQVQTEEVSSIARSGAGGFGIQRTELYTADPAFLPSVQSGEQADYAVHWTQVYSPADTTKTHNFATSYGEFDLINRGSDEGYLPNLYAAPRNTVGWWTGPDAVVPSWVSGGGSAHNWNTVFSIFSTGGVVGVYDGWSIQANALVGAARDPSGHGGVGYDLFGAYEALRSDPFSTRSGSDVVTVAVSGGYGGIVTQHKDGKVYIPRTYTINGVTFGGHLYAIDTIDRANNIFTITGTGRASANGAGGGSGQWIAFSSLVPYAPEQYWGEFKHGIVTRDFHSDAGGIIETQPGNGILWSNTDSTASVSGRENSGGAIDVVLNPGGKGAVRAEGPVTLPGYTVSTLPACLSNLKGAMAYVTDARSPTYNGRVMRGGLVTVPVFCDGSDWTTH